MPSAEVQELYPGLKALCVRDFDLLRFKLGMNFPDRPRRVVNVSQSITMSSDGHTITPGMRHYISDRCRFVLGVEAFCQQGLHFGAQMAELSQVSNSLLLDLAGNAFPTWLVAAVFYCIATGAG